MSRTFLKAAIVVLCSFLVVGVLFTVFSTPPAKICLVPNGKVIEFNTEKEADTELAKAGPRIVMQYADWCEACHAAMPTFKALARDFKQVKFVKVNVDRVTIRMTNLSYSPAFIPAFILGCDDADMRSGRAVYVGVPDDKILSNMIEELLECK
jgi:thiol-disulfide isomerase/thioredoxin